MTEQEARAALVEFGRSLFDRGYSCGSSGNLSVRLPGGRGFLMSPTNVSLGRLSSDTLSRLDEMGQHVAGAPPTKEAWLHLAMYRARPQDSAVVHLHSTYAAALSCRTDVRRRTCCRRSRPTSSCGWGGWRSCRTAGPATPGRLESSRRWRPSIAPCCSPTTGQSWLTAIRDGRLGGRGARGDGPPLLRARGPAAPKPQCGAAGRPAPGVRRVGSGTHGPRAARSRRSLDERVR